jgi:hypothetical protein
MNTLTSIGMLERPASQFVLTGFSRPIMAGKQLAYHPGQAYALTNDEFWMFKTLFPDVVFNLTHNKLSVAIQREMR